jgi:hypothetical protein
MRLRAGRPSAGSFCSIFRTQILSARLTHSASRGTEGLQTRCWRETDSNPRSFRREQHFSRPPGNPATTNRPDGQNWILTIDEGRFTVR